MWTTWLLISMRSCSVSEPRRICRHAASSWSRNGALEPASSNERHARDLGDALEAALIEDGGLVRLQDELDDVVELGDLAR